MCHCAASKPWDFGSPTRPYSYTFSVPVYASKAPRTLVRKMPGSSHVCVGNGTRSHRYGRSSRPGMPMGTSMSNHSGLSGESRSHRGSPDSFTGESPQRYCQLSLNSTRSGGPLSLLLTHPTSIVRVARIPATHLPLMRSTLLMSVSCRSPRQGILHPFFEVSLHPTASDVQDLGQWHTTKP